MNRYAVIAFDNSVDSMEDNTYGIEVINAPDAEYAYTASSFYDLAGLQITTIEVSMLTPLGEVDRSQLMMKDEIPSFIINEPDEIDKLPSISCKRCGYTSLHPKDVKDLWCNQCDKSHII